MNRKKINALDLVAAVNPVPPGDAAALDAEPESERTLALVRARRARDVERPASGPAPVRRRRVALAIVAVLALGVPTLAASGRLGDLFGFSTTGAPVEASDFDPHLATQLKSVGADGNIRRLDVRDGVAFYVARSEAGALCLHVASADAPAPQGIRGSGGCMPPETAKRFPSPGMPVWSMTSYMSPPGGPRAGVFVHRLAGFAADGVADVEFIARDGSSIASVPVANNVFAASGLPQVPIKALVAHDADGNVVWQESHER